MLLEPVEAYTLWASSYPPHAHNPLMMAEEQAMLSCLPESLTGLHLFDVGCGSGRYLRLAQVRGAITIGVDLSVAMLAQGPTNVACATLTALPIRNSWADLTLCGLTIGHLTDLELALVELKRVTKPGGRILISDFHPIGRSLGWKRTFKVGEQKYEVRHTTHEIDEWIKICRHLNLKIVRQLEPRLNPATIPPDARFDPIALTVPVALVFELEREKQQVESRKLRAERK